MLAAVAVVVVVSLIFFFYCIEQDVSVLVEAQVKLLKRRQQLQQFVNVEPVEPGVVEDERSQVSHITWRRFDDRRLESIQTQIDELDSRHLRENVEDLLTGAEKKEKEKRKISRSESILRPATHTRLVCNHKWVIVTWQT